MESMEVDEVVATLSQGVADLHAVDLTRLTARELLALAGTLEVISRRLDHAKDSLAGHIDATGAHGVDGHKTAKAALVHINRVPGAEAHGSIQTARALRRMPEVDAAYAAGTIPTASVRAIARVASNPRVTDLVDELVDRIFAAQAREASHDDLASFVRDWERFADADGAEQAREHTHRRRNASLVRNDLAAAWHLRGEFGDLHGASMAEVLAAYEHAEWLADRDAAIAEHGPGATPDQFPRTAAQRRADAVLAIFRRAAATPADAQSPEPLVSIVIDQETLETELARAAGHPAGHDPSRLDQRICRTTSGHPVHPADAVAAILVGHVRRVVVDAASNVIDLGRRRRCFTGSSRDAALLQTAIRDRGGTTCFWADCNSPPQWMQVDHDQTWRALGPSDIANSQTACGHHNRLKETGYRPVRGPDGTYTYRRPDGTEITPPV